MKKITLMLWILVAHIALASAASAPAVPTSITGENLVINAQQTFVIAPDKTYAIVFLSAKCPCSLSHLTELKNLAQDYPEIQIVGVHSNNDEDHVLAESYFKIHGLTFPVIQDKNNALADQFGALKTPHAFIIANGKVVYRGGVSDRQTFEPDARKYLREAMEDLKQKRPVKTSNTRTLGCAIPRS
jgi:peroxiredoxin